MPASSIAAVTRITRERSRKRATEIFSHGLTRITQIVFLICEIRVNPWLFNQLAQFSPGDELDLVLLKQLTEGVAGEEFEVALAPGGAPIRMVEGCALHFSVIVGEVYDDLSDSGFEFPDRVGIELRPVTRRDGLIDVENSIDVNVVLTQH